MPMSGEIYTLIPQGGLCNRMRMLDSGLMLAAATGRRLVVQWQLDPGLNCRFEELFEIPAGIARIHTQDRTGHFAKLRKTLAKRVNRLRYDQCLYERDLTAYMASHDDLTTLNQNQTVLIASCSRFYGAEPFFQAFRPTTENRARIDHLTARFTPHMIGVHVRRTDHVHAIANSPTQLFVTAMEAAVQQEPETHFFLATDCPATERELSEHFSERIIVHRKTGFDRGDANAIKDALVDLYGLAACQRLLGSALSSFSQTAAQIGCIPLQVISSGPSPAHDALGTTPY